MKQNKLILVLGLAIFASFFGAGNLILPPFLGMNAGPDWWIVSLGFGLSSVFLAVLALIAHARLQGTMLDFGNKVSPVFSLVFCICIYGIGISLPGPRTAAVAHEIGIAPFFETSSLLTSSIYFILVFFFVINRSKVLEILGKFLTPLILILLASIIALGVFANPGEMRASTYDSALISGLLEGYQTYDGMAGLLMGGVVIISLNLEGHSSYKEKRQIIARSSIIAGALMFTIYAGLILTGALSNQAFSPDTTRTDLLMGLSANTLGNFGSVALSVLVTLACFTTAISIIVGTADFVKGLFKDSQRAYLITVVVSCILGVVVGQLDVHLIIQVAIPVLLIIYPLIAVLIFLNIAPEKYASKLVFRCVAVITILFCVPDCVGFFMEEGSLESIYKILPLSRQGMGWLIPSILTFVVANLIARNKEQFATNN